MIIPAKIVAVNSSTYTKIDIGATNNPSRSFSLWLEDGSAFYYATSSAGANEAKVPANMAYNYSDLIDPAGEVMWVKTAAGSVNAVLQLGGRG